MKCVSTGDRGGPEECFLEKLKFLEKFGIEFELTNLDKNMDDALFYAHVRKIETEGPEDIKIKEEILKRAESADIVAVHWTPINKEFLSRAKNLKIIALSRAGYENVNIGLAKEKNIWVINAPGRNKEAVADHAVTLFLATRRRIPLLHSKIKNGKWETYYPEKDLKNMVAGIIGFGSIGRESAKLLKGLGLTVLVYDPYVKESDVKKEGCFYAKFDELLSKSDVILLHARVSDENKHLINYEAFRKMAKKPILVNNARSLLIDTNALIKALEEGLISGAGLDVFDKEPLPIDCPLIKFDNVIMTPHTSNTIESLMYNGPAILAKDIEMILLGKEPMFCVVKGNRP
jgi:D-3-phosphoglycerate dehydrogenase